MRGGTVLSTSANTSDFSEIIAENFGANATYVEGLLNRFRSDPSLVDESWRNYFTELLGESAGNGAGNGNATLATAAPVSGTQSTASAAAPAAAKPAAAPAPDSGATVVPIR